MHIKTNEVAKNLVREVSQTFIGPLRRNPRINEARQVCKRSWSIHHKIKNISAINHSK